MAIENAKLLNVRIKNKYDSYENWVKSNLTLKPGEIAIAYTTVDVKVDNGTAKHPALLMKVGDGEKTFANLPWLSAKAADVLSVCKNETDLTAFVNGVIADAGIASDAAMKELAGKVTTAEGAIDVLKELVGTDKVADQITAAIAALNLDTTYEKVGVAKGLVDALADGAVKDNADAIAAINNEETGVLAQAKDYADGLDSAMNTRVAGLEAKFGDEEGGVKDQIDAAVKVEKERAMGVEGGLETRLATIEGDYLKAADIANMATDAEVEAAVKAEADRAKDIEQDLEGRLAAVEGDYLKAADKTELEGKVTANANAIELLTNGVSAEEVDGVNDLIQYVKDHGTEVTGMKADIKANAEAIDALEAIDHEAYKAADATLKSELEAEIAKKADASVVTALETALDARLDTLEEIDHDAYVDADAALKNELTPLINAKAAQTELDALELLVGNEKVADQINAKIEALNLANTYEAKGAAADALQDAKDYADGLDTAMNTRMEAVEATTATAVQNVTVGDGLVATRAEGSNDVTIGLSEEVTFVLDCGTSGIVTE